MARQIVITVEYFREYRKLLGFSNQTNVRNFLGAKDIVPSVDLDYIDLLNNRLSGLVDKINSVVPDAIRIDDMDAFKKEHIYNAFNIIKSNGVLPSLNNQGRRPEHVYFSWMRGYLLTNYFAKALSIIFEIDESDINAIGDDDLRNIDTFQRTPKADLELTLGDGKKIRIEMQSGFTGINDIKQHKVIEAKREFAETGIKTIAVHFDLYNGQVAFVELDEIENDSENWITRSQMEGQVVLNIDQNYFVWKITEPPVKYKDIDFS